MKDLTNIKDLTDEQMLDAFETAVGDDCWARQGGGDESKTEKVVEELRQELLARMSKDKPSRGRNTSEVDWPWSPGGF